ncbi:MAG: PAS domain-containing protein, partial [Gemmatimonadaceae bacterium]
MFDDHRYRLLVESVRDYGIFMLDANGIVISWNPGAQLIKGYEAHEIIGRHFSAFYAPESVARGWPEEELVMAA